ncbi:MAG: (d)CMP kinase [Salibacteraceae bacterium]
MVFKKIVELKPINIAIDGYAGCGKSTLARDLAKATGFTLVDTGALYRGMTYAFLKAGMAEVLNDVSKFLRETAPELRFDPKTNDLLMNGESIEAAIRNDQRVANEVSNVAAIQEVRTYLLRVQQAYIDQKGVVMEGRDIGTVVMPQADLKVFITADIDTRVKRRLQQLTENGITTTADEVRKNLTMRDEKDTTRDVAPLAMANDAIAIDTGKLNKEQQLAFALALVSPLTDPDKYFPFIR